MTMSCFKQTINLRAARIESGRRKSRPGAAHDGTTASHKIKSKAKVDVFKGQESAGVIRHIAVNTKEKGKGETTYFERRGQGRLRLK